MSYDVEIQDWDGSCVQLPQKHNVKGGTYSEGGTEDASLNITYNYSAVYALVGFSVKDLHGIEFEKGKLMILKAISALPWSETGDASYWTPTLGNARKALVDLLNLSLLVRQPEGALYKWMVS